MAIQELPDSQSTYVINYDVRMADGGDLPPNVTADSVFGKRQHAASEGGSYTFDVLIPFGYTGRVYRYEEGKDGRTELTGDRPDLTDQAQRDRLIVNNGYPIGTEPVWLKSGASDLTRGPAAYTNAGTFLGFDVAENRTLVVELTKRTREPLFDCHEAIALEN